MKLKSALGHLVGGFAIGTTDLVPGFSGATTALILGFYERLLGFIYGIFSAFRSVFHKPRLIKELPKKLAKGLDWRFFIPVLAGLLAAVFSMSSLLSFLLENYPEEIAGFFCGLALIAILEVLRLIIIQSIRQMLGLVAIAIATGILFFWLLGFQSGIHQSPSLALVFGGGVVASAGLILPGISGGFILLMIGLYSPILNDLSDFDLTAPIVLGLGVILGLIIFSAGISWLLNRFRPYLLAILVGLLAGSYRILWPWPNGVGIIETEAENNVRGTILDLPNWSEFWRPFLFSALAFIFMGLLIFFALQFNKKRQI